MLIATLLIGGFVFFGSLVIYESTRSAFILQNVVVLLAAVGIFSVPANKIVNSVMAGDRPELKYAVATPIVVAFVMLGGMILWQGTRADNVFVVENIAALITALSIFSVPTQKIIEATWPT